MSIITEQNVRIKASLPKKDINKKLPIFYNPVMKFNRDVSILLLNTIPNKNMNLALPLAGSGIRGLRFLKELKKDKIKTIYFNDRKPHFKSIIKAALKLNKLPLKKTSIHSEDASLFLMHQEGFDYIDIDPFGSPNPFLPAAMAKISRKGILAVTATDTAALTGTYINACKRKYWSIPLRNELMHEIGLRILIKKIQLIGVQFDKALTPVFSYSKDHYYRVFLRNQKSKSECDKIIKQHQYFHYCNKCLHQKTSPFNQEICQCKNRFLTAGPLWIGNLFDKETVKRMLDTLDGDIFSTELAKLLRVVQKEMLKSTVGFYDLHKIAKVYGIEPPKTELILKKLRAKPTYFSPTGLKTEKNIKEILKAIKK
ncbi:tRNA (guanine(10)-N(2))-dimethyltransferase [Candidatus Woesearchaeota archaeon]|nr:tRNA (guanine(10)-N(2))-dimethyltransferase [Candidatus Woesearchaeota archaeon]